jgi:DNA-binding MarR family transcriptional regulator
MRDDLLRLLIEYVGEAARLGQAFALSQRLHLTDLNALLAVLAADRDGAPLTPGRLGRHFGLSSGATTAVIDRLEQAGHVLRRPDEIDRRRVTLHHGPTAPAVESAYFGPLGRRMDEMLTAYTAAELSVIRRFLAEASELVRSHRRNLQSTGRSRP